MKIIISPAKTMKYNKLCNKISSDVIFDNEANFLFDLLSTYNLKELKEIYKCNDKIAETNFERYKNIGSNTLSNPIYSYDGIQYKNIDISSMNYDEKMYLQNHLLILSSLYGCLKPFDKINLYRLDFNNKLKLDNYKNLYDFWSDKVYNYIASNTDIIINLASKEYCKLMTNYSSFNLQIINCYFGEYNNNKFKEKSTLAKIGRGLFVKYMAINNIDDIDCLKDFNLNDFVFSEELSDKENFYFIKNKLD